MGRWEPSPRDLRSGPIPVTISCVTLGKSLHISETGFLFGDCFCIPKATSSSAIS